MIVGFGYAVIPNILRYGCAARPSSFWKRFESACQARLNSSWQRRQHPQPQFLTKNITGKASQGVTVLSTVQRLYCYSVVHSAMCLCVTARPNLPYIVRFEPYHPHNFVCGDASPLLSLTPQNAYDKLATNTLNKATYHSLTRRCGILQSTPLKKPDDPVGTTGQPVRSALIPNVAARPNDTTKRLMSSPKCRSVEVINNPARPGSNHREVNCINYR